MPLTIWCNASFAAPAMGLLQEGVSRHQLILSPVRNSSVLAGSAGDPALAAADVAFGQPAAPDCLRYPRIRWVHLTSAGYGRYSAHTFLESFRTRGAILSKSSAVFADPVAQHVLGMILGLGRELLPSYREQLDGRTWRTEEHRSRCRLLTGQTVLLLGYGTISRRLVQLLAPFGCKIYALRRQLRSELGVHIVSEADLTKVLPLADHVVNLLPDSESTRNWLNARRLTCFKRNARFYNVGRGTTVDQKALLEGLRAGVPAAAYLDVTEPEPLPPGDPLWTAPNCYITPHTAGGRHDQDEALVNHFLANLAAFEKSEPLTDVVV